MLRVTNGNALFARQRTLVRYPIAAHVVRLVVYRKRKLMPRESKSVLALDPDSVPIAGKSWNSSDSMWIGGAVVIFVFSAALSSLEAAGIVASLLSYGLGVYYVFAWITGRPMVVMGPVYRSSQKVRRAIFSGLGGMLMAVSLFALWRGPV